MVEPTSYRQVLYEGFFRRHKLHARMRMEALLPTPRHYCSCTETRVLHMHDVCEKAESNPQNGFLDLRFVSLFLFRSMDAKSVSPPRSSLPPLPPPPWIGEPRPPLFFMYW